MIKLATLIALLGLTVAQTPRTWMMAPREFTSNSIKHNGLFTYPEDAAMAKIFDKDGYSLYHFAQIDAGFGTLYGGADMTNADQRTESYGLQMWSYAKHQAVMNMNNWYTTTIETYLEPIYVAPYIQHVTWERFEADNGFKLSISGTREVALLDWAVTASELGSTFQHSFFMHNAFELPEMPAELMQDDTFSHDWTDARYSGNLLDTFGLAEDLADVVGTHQYYNTNIVE